MSQGSGRSHVALQAEGEELDITTKKHASKEQLHVASFDEFASFFKKQTNKPVLRYN